MFNFKLEKNTEKKLYIQLFEKIKELIESGEINKNEKLPPIRKSADLLSCNPSTVVNAYDLLESRGYIYKVKGSGTYVSGEKTPKFGIDSDSEVIVIKSSKSDDAINFSDATPSSELFPLKEFKESINKVLDRDGGELFSYQNTKGYEPLRDEIVKYLENQSIDCDKQNIQIASGAQQAIDISGKMLINPGDVVVVEDPTYLGAVSIFKKYGAHIVSFSLESDGINLEKFENFLKREGQIKFIYTMINFHNPTGICWSEEKKKRLLYLAEKYAFYIIEDDSMSEIQFSETKLLSLKSQESLEIKKNKQKEERVIFIKSFSKIFMPGLRLAFMILPDKLIKSAVDLKYISDISGSGLNQRAFQYYLSKNYLENHLVKLINILNVRHEFMKNKLINIKKLKIMNEVKGGNFFWVKLPEWMDADKLYEIAIKKGIMFLPGSLFQFRGGMNNYIRISYAAATIPEIEVGISLLEESVNEYFI